MKTEKKLSGECLCGKVSWQMNGPYEFFGMCQCSRCRKVTGAAFATNIFVKPEQFSWLLGQHDRGEFSLPLPNTFGNAFCKNCGSRVPRQTSRGWILVPLGSTMGLPSIKPTLVCPEDHTEWFTELGKII
jgi:hypothetical protein